MKQETVVNKESFSCVIYMEPRAKGRPRLGKFGNVYNPKGTSIAENFVKAELIRHGAYQIPGPILFKCNFFFKRPKSKKFKNKYFKTSRIDLDNALKLVMDAANKILWRDDSEVSVISCAKVYTDFESHIKIDVEVLDEST